MRYRSDVQNLISQLDLVVLSSLWKGLPFISIEVFSMEKTIVATDVDGTSEIVKDAENGLLSSTKNNEKIADDILYLIKNEDEKTRMKKIQNIYII